MPIFSDNVRSEKRTTKLIAYLLYMFGFLALAVAVFLSSQPSEDVGTQNLPPEGEVIYTNGEAGPDAMSTIQYKASNGELKTITVPQALQQGQKIAFFPMSETASQSFLGGALSGWETSLAMILCALAILFFAERARRHSNEMKVGSFGK